MKSLNASDCCAVLASLILVSGCSFSASSESISNSISSPFESSSESSKSDQTRYEDDVQDFTSAFVAAGGGEAQTFQNGIATMASERGISDWESNPGTWQAVGRGLAGAKVNDAQFMAYQESWAGHDPTRKAQVRQGYDDER
jgi:hypothetical protein